MLAQQAGVSDADHRSREPLLSSIAGFVLLGALLYILNRSYDTKALDSLLARATAGAGAATVEGLSASLGDEQQFFTDFQQAAGGASGPENRSMLEGKVREIRVRWAQWKRENNVSAMRQALGDLMAAGTQVRNNQGALRPLEETEKALTPYNRTAALDRPGETVAPLGRMLFTDYLIPVELAGTLLLVATIGAIAITGRRPEGLR